MSKKNLVIIIIAIILIIIGIVLLKRNNESQSQTDNTKTEQPQTVASPIIQKKSNGTYEIFNTNIKTDTGSTRIKAAVKNVSGVATPQQTVDLVLLDKNNNELGTIKTIIPSLENGASTTISVEDLKVYENIYDFKIK